MDLKGLSLLHRLTRILDLNHFGTIDYELAKFFLDNYRSISKIIVNYIILNSANKASTPHFRMETLFIFATGILQSGYILFKLYQAFSFLILEIFTNDSIAKTR